MPIIEPSPVTLPPSLLPMAESTSNAKIIPSILVIVNNPLSMVSGLYQPMTAINPVKANMVSATEPKILCNLLPAPILAASAVKISRLIIMPAILRIVLIPF